MTPMGNQSGDALALRPAQAAPVVVAIDDDRVVLRAIEKTLVSAGMVCHTATNGAAGLELIREHQADLVLLDILLVGEDGFTLCREIRRTWSPEELPVIMVTGLEDLESIKAAYASGANDFLAKPLHWKHLPYRIWHMLQASHGITERKKTEERLRLSEEKFATVFQMSPDAIDFVRTRDRVALDLNHAFTNLFGYRPEDFIGKPVLSEELDLWVNPEDRHRLMTSLQEHGQVLGFEALLRRKDKSTFLAEIACAALEIDGEPYHLSITRDITERRSEEIALRESEDRFRTLVEWLPDAVGVHRGGKLLYANAAALSLYGAKSAKELVGRSIFDIIHPDFRQIALERLERPASEQADEPMIAARHLKLDGTPMEVETESTSITYGGARSTLVVIRDITERKKLEAEKAVLGAQLLQRQKAESLSRMAGAIAHHFNNKLQSVMANLELMSGPEGMDPAQCLNRAKQATEKAAEVSRMLLLYLGQGSGRSEPLSLSGLCRDCLAHLRGTLPDNLVLETGFPTPGTVIKADADHLQQALASLVANAREAMGDARGSIRLSLGTCPAAEIPAAHRFPIGWQPQEPDYACLEVTDTGCGIVDTDIERVFDPFFSTKFTGRGLGLPVVLGIVQAHGGALTVASKPGQGSVFRIYLPVCHESVLAVPELGSQAPAPEAAGTLLLVDDDEFLLMATGALIERMGFTLLTAKDGVEAVEVFRQHRTEIRVVITDLTMPRMDGWKTLTALRRIEPALPVILTSGYDKAQVLSGEHSDLPQAFLGKPFGLQQLRDALGQVLAVQVPKS